MEQNQMTDSDRVEAFEQVLEDVGVEFNLVQVYPGREDFTVNVPKPKTIPRKHTEELKERGYRLVGVTFHGEGLFDYTGDE